MYSRVPKMKAYGNNAMMEKLNTDYPLLLCLVKLSLSCKNIGYEAEIAIISTLLMRDLNIPKIDIIDNFCKNSFYYLPLCLNYYAISFIWLLHVYIHVVVNRCSARRSRHSMPMLV